MHTSTQDADIPFASARTACLRRNACTAEIVEKAIALQENCGTKHAAEFLRRKMVNIEVATRVLSSPSQRRNYIDGA